MIQNRKRALPPSGLDIATSAEEFREAEREGRRIRHRKQRSEQKQLRAEMNRQWEAEAKKGQDR